MPWINFAAIITFINTWSLDVKIRVDDIHYFILYHRTCIPALSCIHEILQKCLRS